MKKFSLKILALLVILLLGGRALPLDVPPLKSRVMDFAGILTPSQIYRLEEKLYLFEKQTSNQIAILAIPSLEGESIEEYSIRVVEKWKLGVKGKDNGVLLLIAMKERKIRIEVGYGLEGALPDILAFNIIRTQIAPRFKRGKYYEGILAGVESIMDAIKGEYVAEAPPERARGGAKSIGSLLTFIFLMLLFLLPGRGRMGWFWAGVGMGSFFRGGRGGGFGGFGGGGGGFGGGGASGGW